MTEYMPTPWGYDVESSSTGLDPLISPDDFASLTSGAYAADDLRVVMTLRSVSGAIRSYCCWHVSPVLQCRCLPPTDGGRLLTLPALRVDSVDSVTELGAALVEGQYEARSDGLLRRAQFRGWPAEWGSVQVEYKAGFTTVMVPELAQTVAQITASCLAAPAGIRDEQAGQVRLTYNQTAPGVSGGVTLLDRDLAMLEPYRLQEA